MFKRNIIFEMKIYAFTCLIMFFAADASAVELPFSAWKGAVPIGFKLRCIDTESKKEITNCLLYLNEEKEEALFNYDRTEQDFIFLSRKIATSNGRKQLRNFSIYLVLGTKEDTLKLIVYAEGYSAKEIILTRDKVRIDEYNKLVIELIRKI